VNSNDGTAQGKKEEEEEEKSRLQRIIWPHKPLNVLHMIEMNGKQLNTSKVCTPLYVYSEDHKQQNNDNI